jgi:hypothetical protein
MWGLVFGGLQAASPLAFWWLDTAVVYALGLALIASIYIGFAVADGRPAVLAVESAVATIFVVVADRRLDRGRHHRRRDRRRRSLPPLGPRPSASYPLRAGVGTR